MAPWLKSGAWFNRKQTNHRQRRKMTSKTPKQQNKQISASGEKKRNEHSAAIKQR
jgi:hypothetical protein